MILITGATGGLGNETIKALLKKIPASQIIALVRDKDKALELYNNAIEVRIGDYNDYNSLVTAFKGIDKVLAVSASAFSDRVTQEKNVINAAAAAGIKHVLFTSIQRKENSEWVIPYVTEANHIIENHLKNSGLAYTILKNTLYFDTLPFLLGNVLEQGLKFPAGNGRIAFASRQDLGEGIAEILIGNDFVNQEITLSNSQSWSLEDIAVTFSELASREILFDDVTKEKYISNRIKFGVPQIAAEFASDWAAACKIGEFQGGTNTLEKLLGRKPTDLKSYIHEAFFSI